MLTPTINRYFYDQRLLLDEKEPHPELLNSHFHKSIEEAHAKKLDFVFVVYQVEMGGKWAFYQGEAATLPKNFAWKGTRLEIPVPPPAPDADPLYKTCEIAHFFVIPSLSLKGHRFATQIVSAGEAATNLLKDFQEANDPHLHPGTRCEHEFNLAKKLLIMKKYLSYLRYLGRAASSGQLEAISDLVNVYLHGVGRIKPEVNKAFSWAILGAKKYHMEELQHRLGTFYEKGIGTTKNAPLAFQWVLEAVKNAGKPQAKYLLGCYYLNGTGTKKDPLKALKWLKEAAAEGYPQANYHLGMLYQEGAEGIPASPIESKKYLIRTKELGTRLLPEHEDLLLLPKKSIGEGKEEAPLVEKKDKS